MHDVIGMRRGGLLKSLPTEQQLFEVVARPRLASLIPPARTPPPSQSIAEGIKSEQIAVAAYDQVGVTIDRQLQKFVIRGIAASGDAIGDHHQLAGGHQLPQPGLRIDNDAFGLAQVVRTR